MLGASLLDQIMPLLASTSRHVCLTASKLASVHSKPVNATVAHADQVQHKELWHRSC